MGVDLRGAALWRVRRGVVLAATACDLVTLLLGCSLLRAAPPGLRRRGFAVRNAGAEKVAGSQAVTPRRWARLPAAHRTAGAQWLVARFPRQGRLSVVVQLLVVWTCLLVMHLF